MGKLAIKTTIVNTYIYILSKAHFYNLSRFRLGAWKLNVNINLKLNVNIPFLIKSVDILYHIIFIKTDTTNFIKSLCGKYIIIFA